MLTLCPVTITLIIRLSSQDTIMMCLRCMTGSIILYDHLDAQGAFHKHSPIDVRKCITALTQAPDKGVTAPIDGLLNALRFTTLHLNDATTPRDIVKLLD